jgi:hypothetical protein
LKGLEYLVGVYFLLQLENLCWREKTEMGVRAGTWAGYLWTAEPGQKVQFSGDLEVDFVGH